LRSGLCGRPRWATPTSDCTIESHSGDRDGRQSALYWFATQLPKPPDPRYFASWMADTDEGTLLSEHICAVIQGPQKECADARKEFDPAGLCRRSEPHLLSRSPRQSRAEAGRLPKPRRRKCRTLSKGAPAPVGEPPAAAQGSGVAQRPTAQRLSRARDPNWLVIRDCLEQPESAWCIESSTEAGKQKRVASATMIAARPSASMPPALASRAEPCTENRYPSSLSRR